MNSTKKIYKRPIIRTHTQIEESSLCDGSLIITHPSEDEGTYDDNTINAKRMDTWELWDVWESTLDESWNPYV